MDWDVLEATGKAGGDTGGALSVTRMHWEALGVSGIYWKTLEMLGRTLGGHWEGLGGTGGCWDVLGGH